MIQYTLCEECPCFVLEKFYSSDESLLLGKCQLNYEIEFFPKEPIEGFAKIMRVSKECKLSIIRGIDGTLLFIPLRMVQVNSIEKEK